MTPNELESDRVILNHNADGGVRRQLLIVVDDRRRFAVHVWRHLSFAMEFGFPERKTQEAASSSTSAFARTSSDGMLEVRWHDPNSRTLKQYTDTIGDESKRDPSLCIWTVIDVRGVRDVKDDRHKLDRPAATDGHTHAGVPLERIDHESYFKAFINVGGTHASKQAWIVSAYGGGWGNKPRIWPKSIETLDALRDAMGLNKRVSLRSELESPANVAVLVTGAGFELKSGAALRNDGAAEATVDIGFPETADLLEAMRPDGKGITWTKGKPGSYPALRNVQQPNTPAMWNLDRYWDELLEHVSGKKTAATGSELTDSAAADREYAWREAFRRSLLAHDFGQQLQSVAAARLDLDYWLSTNYSRFADRAIDLISDVDCASDQPAAKKPPPSNPVADHRPLLWRAITTQIEADALSPDLYSERDIARVHRVLLKLHGDIGHTWTMAVAGQDKLPRSKLYVRPELHRMYTVAQAMLLTTLWERNAATCTWHIVGHGLRDKALLHLIATVILRSPSKTVHQIVWVAPRAPESQPEAGGLNAVRRSMFDQTADEAEASLAAIKERFQEAGELEFASRISSFSKPSVSVANTRDAEPSSDGTAAQWTDVREIVSGGPFFVRAHSDAIGYMSYLCGIGLDAAAQLCGSQQQGDLRAPRVPTEFGTE